MEPKKSTKADVSRNSSIYFAVGLALMLLFANVAINYKTYDKSDIDIGQLNLDEELEEEIPITEQIQTPPPPPPPPAAPEEIEIVEDEEEVEETVIESTETDQEEEIVEVEEVEVEEVEEDIEVPFAVIENVPVFPGCENESGNNAKKQCMSEKISKFVNKKFNTDLAGELGLSGRQRINVIFKIDKSGNITNIMARAPHPGLEKEAKRVIGLLPKMKPGKQRGKAVTVPYSLPILFQVQD
ncbi:MULTISPECIES: energy transducer TonB [Flavobacteriaceae]|jgi:protein TonB|uniref:TonB C-terminal domain-containing protein n=2 Tax=Flavobacteriaceae TaxID=49546 RepID=A0ABN1JCA5_9FLAO|nr:MULTISPECIES: energy transducer TonB [Flavobacteriaceae]RYH73537.1 energy transducer TonB [Flavobacteriaceae bacterium 144Ye]TBV25260.1 energy transducer TonB [Meridianimaribacter sp. CL38]TDY10675.1 protein TonB [Meridianimaribacter flavus]